MRKPGRKRKNYETKDGDTIVGLGQLFDGRWVDLDDRSHPWTSNHEIDAIREFNKRRIKRNGETISITTNKGKFLDMNDLQNALESHGELTIDVPKNSVEVTAVLPTDAVWETVGRIIRENPKQAADRTGIKGAWMA